MAVSDGVALPGPIRAFDGSYGGPGSISGKVLVDATESPLVRQVRLLDQQSSFLVAQTWSDSNGDYSFDYLKIGPTYLVYSIDYTKTYEAEILAEVTAT